MPTPRHRSSLACLAAALIPLCQASANAEVRDSDLRPPVSPTSSAFHAPEPAPPTTLTASTIEAGNSGLSRENVASAGGNEAQEVSDSTATGLRASYLLVGGALLLGLFLLSRRAPITSKPPRAPRPEGLCGTG